jgi:ATP-dependent RNA helicase DDX35
MVSLINPVFQGFLNSKRSSGWCANLFLDVKALNRVHSITQELSRILKRLNVSLSSCGSDISALCKCILSVYHTNIAKLQTDGTYTSLKGQKGLYIHPSSVLQGENPKWIVYQNGMLF